MKKSKHRIIVLLALAFLFGGKPAYSQTEIKLIPSDSDTSHQFGYDVAISGNQIITSAPGNPKTYIYENISGWTETFSYVRNNSLCVGGLFSYCQIYGSNSKQVDIKGDFAITGGGWFEHYYIDTLGVYHFINTEHYAVMFRKVNGIWGEYYTPSSNYDLGEVTSVGINDTTGLIGCESYDSDKGGIWVLDPSNSGNLYSFGDPNERLGGSISTSGQFAVIGGYGSVRVYPGSGMISPPSASLGFGQSVAIQGDSIIIVGDPWAGKVYVYKKRSWNGSWDLLNTIKPKSAYGFGSDVAISNNIVAVGSPNENNSSGAVYLYSIESYPNYRTINTSPFKIITASDAWEGMNFGEELDISDETLVVGVKNDSTNGTFSGAVYIYNCFMGATASIVSAPDYGASTGSINLSVYGGIEPYQYSWNTGQITEDISGLASGTYSVTVTDQNSCSVNQAIDLTYNPRLQSAEYFFDTDPGVGNGTSFGLNSLTYSLDTTYTVSVAALSIGFHNLFIRHIDENGDWGITEGRAFYVFPEAILNPSGPIIAMEYFFDTDLGVGNGTAMAVASADTINNVFDVDITGLSEGFHNLYFRAKTDDNIWGITEGRTFYIISGAWSNPSGPINAMEYFFDTDPGIGNGTAMAVASADTINNVFDVNITGLSEGFHNLYFRAKTENNIWGITEGRAFYVFPDAMTNPSGPINAMEYFFDSDPGVGNGTALTLVQSDTINNVFDVNTSGLSNGLHHIYFRFKDTYGTWGIYEGGEFELKNALVMSAFLEGAYNGTDMDNGLNEKIPLSQPYNTAPWNYGGTEAVASIPADAVDWVLLEYRETPFVADSAKSGTIVGRKAGFLLQDGSIVDVDGSGNLLFDQSFNDNLYIVLWHRNHIGIMSAFPLVLNDGRYEYDFTTDASQVHGGVSGHVHLGSGIYGMAGGDANADGSVDGTDKTFWSAESGKAGYLVEDQNLDGQVNNPDKNDVWFLNNNIKTSQVPE